MRYFGICLALLTMSIGAIAATARAITDVGLAGLGALANALPRPTMHHEFVQGTPRSILETRRMGLA